jgi:hypothetical protein
MFEQSFKMSSEQIRETWSFIVAKWTVNEVAAWKNEWRKALVKEGETPDSFKTTCSCGNRVSKEHYCPSLKICMFCDYWCQPHLANPRNRHLVKHWLPEHEKALFEE